MPPDRAVAVFADTNTLIRVTYRLPLLASAQVGDLAIFWSDAIRAEFMRVTARATFASVVLAELDRALLVAPVAPRPENAPELMVPDPDDLVHVLTANHANVPYLLTLDRRHLPHGQTFLGVQCWHPDTFLTLFYQQNPDAYGRVKQTITELPASFSQRLLP